MPTPRATAPVAPADAHSPRRAWAAVAVLALVGTLNYVDRFLPAVLAEPIKHDLELSDTAIGVINGFGFLIVYAVLGIVIARVADRGAFGAVISGCLTLWGAMTMLGGAVQSGFQLALTRVGVAVGEAGSTPAAHAYVARNFLPERRAAPLAVITFAIPLASTASLIGGGLLAENLGWRTAFVIIGGVSVAVAPLVWLVVGARQTLPAVDVRTTTVNWWDLLRKPSFLAMVGGTALISAAGYSLTTFSPAFLMRTRGMSLSEVGFEYGLATGLFGVLGLLIVGRLADHLAERDARWLLWIVVVLTAVLLPASVLAFVVADRLPAVVFLALSYVIGTAYLAPSIAAIQRLVLPEQRATASAIFLFFNAIFGSVGPFVTGLISDTLTPDLGSQALGRALLMLVPTLQLLAMGCYLAAARWYRRDIVEGGT
ncbi:major facilitator superfamily protein [Mycolicibacterium mageritense DSM 44476 = CIP 104973]|uniref:Hexuronate transporter n=1 Tax=Mycolicibacterium mageritense TaxID=53462 RepID=A0AAI8U0I1_MYCME|nr:MFS transporter [Mycolicibacterium mageritense]MCC9180575.1 MFS transporter [Mycolicibacterium mageritense]TXI64196.1 MAG: MFS transporter [Mycolicibacterium mageritense]CDO25889.1 major facilitator superfamily protein [Mycolicibacterium mageritense DSM 44476 = CIP 104973]BBX37444.1 MFS-type efflux pump [Mycolicibacterium mageritense]BDY32266.1 Hexuronate transporter [Mycolicibacterium mageritense]